jgi:glycosyltransferase involved in cell wall biosynthesis
LKNKINILVLTYWQFNDALIQTYTLPYLRIIEPIIPNDSKIFLMTLDHQKHNPKTISPKIINISKPYFPFGIKSIFEWIKNLFNLYVLIKKEKIQFIHCWCTPAGSAGYILSKLTGVKLIIDSFEPHAEAMVENGTWKKNSIAFKTLFMFEKWQSKRATFLIAATKGMKKYVEEKYHLDNRNLYVKPACVDLNLFSFKNKKRSDLLKKLNLEDKIICIYAGKFGGIYLDYEVFDFFKQCHLFWGDQFHALILSSHKEEEIRTYAKKANFPLSALTLTFVNHNQIPDYMGLGDFGITPVKSVPSKQYCTPIKNGEYWALGLPVVITPNISDDSEIIENNKIGSVIKQLSTEGYLNSIKEIDLLLTDNTLQTLYDKIRPIAES